jgi:cell division protease FtsH
MGHAIVAMALPGTDPVQKVSIIPRGIGALGYTIQRPLEDRFLMSSAELENKITVLLGGRAAESIVFPHISTGAADDLGKATEIARSMVARYGMVDAVGQVVYDEARPQFLGDGLAMRPVLREHSEATAREIDLGVKALVEEAYARATTVLRERRAVLDAATTLLLERETLSAAELPFGPRPPTPPTLAQG